MRIIILFEKVQRLMFLLSAKARMNDEEFDYNHLQYSLNAGLGPLKGHIK